MGFGVKTGVFEGDNRHDIGINAVYHFTDCPSFICNDQLYILDPHHRYIVHDKKMAPCKVYKDLIKLWERFPDMKPLYLISKDIPFKVGDGILFRLPLRLTKEAAEDSEFVSNSDFFDLAKLENHLSSWILQELHSDYHWNLCHAKLFIIDDLKSLENLEWRKAENYNHVRNQHKVNHVKN